MYCKLMTGLIYKIVPICEHEDGDIYFGSTEATARIRMDRHRNSYNHRKRHSKGNHCRAFNLFDKYGINNCKMIILETVSLDLLEIREAYYIETIKNINKNRPGRLTALGRTEYNRLDYLQYNEPIKCNVCNCHITKHNFRHHEKTVKHQHNLTILEDNTEYDYIWSDGTPCTQQEYEDNS